MPIIMQTPERVHGRLRFDLHVHHVVPLDFAICSFAAATTLAGVKPNLVSRSLSGAEEPNVCHADLGAGRADIAVPADHRAHLDRDARRDVRRKNAIAVRLILLLEQFPGRHADDACRNALALELFISVDAESDLAAGADQDHRRLAVRGVGENIGATGQTCGRRVARAVEGRQRLAAQHQTGRLMLEPDDDAPRFDDFVGVGRAERDESGDAAQREELLDRLVRRSVLAHADRVVGEDIDDRKLHQRGKADGRFHVVGKDKEARAEGSDLGQCEPVQDRAHGVLADAEMHVAAARGVGFEIAGALECEPGLGGRREIGRAADQPRVMRGNGVEHLAGRVARGKALRVGGENRKGRVPVLGKLAPLHALDPVGKVGVLFSVGFEQRAPIFWRPLPRRPMPS